MHVEREITGGGEMVKTGRGQEGACWEMSCILMWVLVIAEVKTDLAPCLRCMHLELLWKLNEGTLSKLFKQFWHIINAQYFVTPIRSIISYC